MSLYEQLKNKKNKGSAESGEGDNVNPPEQETKTEETKTEPAAEESKTPKSSGKKGKSSPAKPDPNERSALRDSLAAAALSGLCARYGFELDADRAATEAYDLADAALTARD